MKSSRKPAVYINQTSLLVTQKNQINISYPEIPPISSLLGITFKMLSFM